MDLGLDPGCLGRVGDRVLVFMRGEKPAMREVPARGDIKGRALGLLEAPRAGESQSGSTSTLMISTAAAGSSTRGDRQDCSPTAEPSLQISPYDAAKSCGGWSSTQPSDPEVPTTDQTRHAAREKGVPATTRRTSISRQTCCSCRTAISPSQTAIAIRGREVLERGQVLDGMGQTGSGPGEFQTPRHYDRRKTSNLCRRPRE